MPSYSRFLYQAGQGKNAWWRYAMVLFIAWILPYIATNLNQTVAIGYFGRDSLAWFIFHFIRYIFSPLLLFLLFKRVHHRPFSSLLHANSKFNWQQLGFGILLSFGLLFTLSIIWVWGIKDHPFEWFWEIDKENMRLRYQLFSAPLYIIGLILFFKSYLFQGINLWLKKPLYSIIGLTLFIYLIQNFDMIQMALMGLNRDFLPSTWEMYSRPLISAGFFINFILLGLIVLGEGIELAISFLLGKTLYSILVDETGMYSIISKDGLFIDPSYIFFFSNGWGSIIYLAIFLLIVWKKFKLQSLQVLLTPVPRYIGSQQHLIDQIGADDQAESSSLNNS